MTGQKRRQDTCIRPSCPNKPSPWGHGLCQAHARINADRYVPAGPVIRHVHDCLAAGATTAGIAEHTNVPIATVSRIVLADAKRPGFNVRSSTFRNLLAATGDMVSTGMVPAWSIQRRLRSLRAAGWEVKELSEALGTSSVTIKKISGDNPPNHVRGPLAKRVREFFAEHMAVVGPPSRSVKARGWPLPIEWANIDDPHEDPKTRQSGGVEDDLAARRSRKRQAIPDEVAETMRWAVHTANQSHVDRSRTLGSAVVAERLGLSVPQVRAIMNRKMKLLPPADLDRVMVRLGLSSVVDLPDAG